MPGALNLPALWTEASRRFLHLITLLPEVLEAYHCEDAQGSTVRRWAVLSDEATVTVDASVTPRPAPAAGGAPPPPAAAGHSVADSKQQQQQPRGQERHAEWPGAPSQGLQQELAFLERRYGLRQLPPVEAAAAQLAGLHVSKASNTAAAPAAGSEAAPAGRGPAAAFELALKPTDPAWQPGSHPLHLLLQGWATHAYPQPGSLVLAVSPQQPQLGQLPREVLDKLLAGEVSAALLAGARRGGAAGALGTVVRHVANHAGRLWEQAEDIAAEVARRRQLQAGRQAQQPGQHAPGARQDEPPPPQQEQQQHHHHQRQHASDSSASWSDLDDDGAYAGSSDFGGSSHGGGSGWSEEEEEEGEGGKAAAARSGQGQRGGGHSEASLPLCLQLEGLELVDCDCLELLRLNLQAGAGCKGAAGVAANGWQGSRW